MNMAYLGFWSDTVGWVMEKIMDPVFSFVGGLLNSALTWLFQVILAPLLKNILIPLAIEIAKLILQALSGVFYSIMVEVWRILDSMEQAYNIFIGIDTVTIVENGVRSPHMTLLEALYSITTIRNAFWYIFVVALVMLFMFTIYSVAKSIFDLETEKPHTVSHVMNSFLRACVQFLIVPLFVLFMIRFSGVLVTTLDNAVQESSDSGDATIGSTLFVISSLDASKKSEYNISTASAEMKTKLGINDEARKDYYTNGSRKYPDKTYWNTSQVSKDFVYAKFDFIVGFGVGFFVFIVMVSNSVVFIQRIFDMLLLYLASPFFVSTMPLDDGERFKRWRELFIGKSVSGMGGIVAMKLYLLIVPVVISGQISFMSLAAESTETVYVLKVLFLIGGAWAATKSGSMVTSLISSAAGSSESQSASVGTGAAISALSYAYDFAKAGAGYGKKLFSGGKEEDDDDDDEEESGTGGTKDGEDGVGENEGGKIPGLSADGKDGDGDDDNHLETIDEASEEEEDDEGDEEPQAAGAADGDNAGGEPEEDGEEEEDEDENAESGPEALDGAEGEDGEEGEEGEGEEEEDENADGGPEALDGAEGEDGAEGGEAEGAASGGGAGGAAAAAASPFFSPSNRLKTKAANTPQAMTARQKRNAQVEKEKAALPPQRTKRFLGLTFKTGRDGKYHLNVNMGGLYSHTYGADGSETVKVMGLEVRANYKGEVDKAAFLGIGRTVDNMGEVHTDLNLGNFIQRHVDADGSSSVSYLGGLFGRAYDEGGNKVNTRNFGVERQMNTVTGEMYTRRNFWTGLEKVQDKSGNLHVKSHYGNHYKRDKNGNYNFSRGWGVRQKNMINEEGKSECVGRSFLGINFYDATSKRERLSQLDINKPKEKKDKK